MLNKIWNTNLSKTVYSNNKTLKDSTIVVLLVPALGTDQLISCKGVAGGRINMSIDRTRQKIICKPKVIKKMNGTSNYNNISKSNCKKIKNLL